MVNPHWRALDAQVRHHNAKLNRELASFAEAGLPADPKPEDVGKWKHKKATLQKAIEQRRQKIETLKSERKAAGKHIALKGSAAGGSLQSATQREEAREELTATETVFPGTDLRLIFQLVGSS